MFGFNDVLGNVFGYNIVGGAGPDEFYVNRAGKFYIVNQNTISSTTSDYSEKPVYGSTIASLRDISKGELGDASSDAVQATLSRRPVFGSLPRNGRKNLLNFSNKLMSVPWFVSSLASSIVVDDENSLNGRECYILRSIPNITGDSYIYQNLKHSDTAHRTYHSSGNVIITTSIFAKPLGDNGYMPKNFSMILSGTTSSDRYASFNFYGASGQVTPTTSSGVSTNIVALDDGWYRLSMTMISEIPNQNVFVKYGFPTQINGDGSSILISSPQVEYSPIYTKYQDVNNNFDIYDENGQNVECLIFDGIDDSINIPVEASHINSDCDVIIVGTNKSFVVPFRILNNTIAIGPTSIGNTAEDILSKIGGLVAFGYITPKLTKNDYDILFYAFQKIGGSANYTYPYESQIMDILDGYTDASYEIVWPKPDRLYKDSAFTTKASAVNDVCNGFIGLKSTQFVANGSSNQPSLAKLAYGMAVRNILDYSDNFSMWNFTTNADGAATITPNYALGPFNVMNATRIQMSIGSSYTTSSFNTKFSATQTPIAIGTQMTFSFWARTTNVSDTYTSSIRIGVNNVNTFNITLNGVWQRVSCTVTTNSITSNYPVFMIRGDSVIKNVDFLIYGAQMEMGATPSALQIKKSRYDFSENGAKEVWAIRLDGVDDFYTSSTNFDTGNNFAVFAAFRTLTADAIQTVVGKTPTTNGTVQLNAVNNLTDKAPGFSVGNTSVKGLTRSQGYSATIRTVRANNNIIIYENGIAIQNVASTNYTSSNTPIDLFANLGTGNTHSNYFSGYVGPIVITKGFVPSNEDMNRIDNILQEYTGAGNA